MASELLQPPPEPLDIKKALRILLESQGKAKYIVFAGNQLPKYLWDHWSEELHRLGLKWQDLLQALSRNTDKALAWIAGETSWKELIHAITRDLLARSEERGEKKRGPTRTLVDYL